MTPALSFIIPMYNSAPTIAALVRDLDALTVEGGHEIVLVNDGSADETMDVCRELVRTIRTPIVVVDHARNFGEHNAVLSGWRHATGRHFVNLDDDGQNPPDEAVRLWREAVATGLDVVYGHYEVKQHSWFRNLGSWVTNRMTDLALDKPAGFYLSSFRCVSGFIARQVTNYAGPYPYIDGLLLQVTQRIGSITVRARCSPRRAERLHPQASDPFVAERVAEFFAAAVAPGHPAGVCDGARRTRRLRAGDLAVVHEPRTRVRMGLGDGGVAGVLRHAARHARADRRIPGANVPHGQPAPAVDRA